MSDLEYILQMLKRRGRPTFSDTPGGGNVAPWQMGRGGRLERWYDRDWSQSNDNIGRLFQHPDFQMPRDQRMDLERMFMDDHLNEVQGRQRLQQRYGGTQLMAPEKYGRSTEGIQQLLMDAFRRKRTEM